MHPHEAPANKRSPLKMFGTLVKVGAFVIGGGYAMIPILQTEFVEKLGWLDEQEFMDIIALSQSAPGAMVINLSIYLGYSLFGVGGALLGLLGTSLPAFVIMALISTFFVQFKANFGFVEKAFRGIGPVVAGVIFASAVKMVEALDRKLMQYVLLAATVLAVAVLPALGLAISPIYCIIGGGALGLLFMRERGQKDA